MQMLYKKRLASKRLHMKKLTSHTPVDRKLMNKKMQSLFVRKVTMVPCGSEMNEIKVETSSDGRELGVKKKSTNKRVAIETKTSPVTTNRNRHKFRQNLEQVQ